MLGNLNQWEIVIWGFIGSSFRVVSGLSQGNSPHTKMPLNSFLLIEHWRSVRGSHWEQYQMRKLVVASLWIPLQSYWVPGLSRPDPTKSHPGKCANGGIRVQRRVSGIRFVAAWSSFCSAPAGFPQLGWCYEASILMECLVQFFVFCACGILLDWLEAGMWMECFVQFLVCCYCAVLLCWLEDGISM